MGLGIYSIMNKYFILVFFLIKNIKGKIIMLNIGSNGFIKNERNVPGKFLENWLTSFQDESDL